MNVPHNEHCDCCPDKCLGCHDPVRRKPCNRTCMPKTGTAVITLSNSAVHGFCPPASGSATYTVPVQWLRSLTADAIDCTYGGRLAEVSFYGGRDPTGCVALYFLQSPMVSVHFTAAIGGGWLAHWLAVGPVSSCHPEFSCVGCDSVGLVVGATGTAAVTCAADGTISFSATVTTGSCPPNTSFSCEVVSISFTAGGP